MCSEKKMLNAEVDIDMERCEKTELLHENKNKVVLQFDCCKRITLTPGELKDWQQLAASFNRRIDG